MGKVKTTRLTDRLENVEQLRQQLAKLSPGLEYDRLALRIQQSEVPRGQPAAFPISLTSSWVTGARLDSFEAAWALGWRSPMDHANQISPFLDNISWCRTRAEQCRRSAKNSLFQYEIDAWLDFADDWDHLADAFDLERMRRN
jgi:hypothetical protein